MRNSHQLNRPPKSDNLNGLRTPTLTAFAAFDGKLQPMTTKPSIKYPANSGLTLIELLVVLTILIALGGIVVASLPGLLSRTQSATAAANVPEIDSAIRRKMVTANGVIGNRFDALVTGGTGANGEVADYIGGKEYFQAVAISQEDVEALANIGLTELIPATANPSDATFDSHMQQPIPVANDTRVCSVSKAFTTEIMERIWNLTPTDDQRFLVFGLGSRSSLVGGSETALFPEAPVHFSDQASSRPKNMYSRYLIVIELKTRTDGSSRARYVGVAIPDSNGIHGIGQELQQVYTQENPSQ